MNLKDMHLAEKPVSAVPFFEGTVGKTVAIRLLKGEKLKEHISKTPAKLLCVLGNVVFENEKGQRTELSTGDYTDIEPMVLHWLDAESECHLILLK